MSLQPKLGDTAVPLTFNLNVLGQGGETGATVLVAIRRISDGFYLDWDDDTFKSSAWTTRQIAMTEVDATDSEGVYEHIWDSSLSVTALGKYSQENKVTLPVEFKSFTSVAIAFEQSVWDELESEHVLSGSMGEAQEIGRMFITNRLEMDEGASGNWKLYRDNSSTLRLTWSVKDKDGNMITPDLGDAAQRVKAV